MTNVLQVHATDRDIGVNAQLTYSLTTASQAAFGKTFKVDNVTGRISVSGILDYEMNPVYQLMVSVTDGGSEPLTAETMVLVQLVDANDNAPRITVNTLTASETNVARVAEDAVKGTFVAHVIARDPDSGRNGRINCTVEDKMQQFELRTMYETEYQVVTAHASLDREHIPR